MIPLQERDWLELGWPGKGLWLDFPGFPWICLDFPGSGSGNRRLGMGGPCQIVPEADPSFGGD